MVTRLKKSKKCHDFPKLIAVFLLIISTIFGSITFLSYVNIMASAVDYTYDSFYKSQVFSNQYNQLVRDVINVNLAYVSENNIKAGNTLDNERLLTDFINENSLNPDIVNIIRDFEENDIVLTEDIINYELNISDEERKSLIYYVNHFDVYKKNATSRQLEDFRKSKSEIDKFPNFVYCLVLPTGEIKNSNREYINGLKVNTVMDGIYTSGKSVYSSNYYFYYDDKNNLVESYYYDNYQDSIEKILEENNSTIYCGIRDNLMENTPFYNQKEHYEHNNNILPYLLGVSSICLIINMICILFLVVTAGRRKGDKETYLLPLDKIYNDIHLILLIICYYIVSICIYYILYNIGDMSMQNNSSSWILLMTVYFVVIMLFFTIITTNFLTSLSRQFKKKQIIKNTLISVIVEKIGRIFSSQTFKGWLIFCMFVYAGANIILFSVLINMYTPETTLMALIILILFNIISAAIVLRGLRSLKKIMVAVKETKNGNFSSGLDLEEISPSFYDFASDVSGIQTGLKDAVQKAVRGERMKTELITNVSHDLKTPLTSIVTYSDLLRNEKIDNPNAQKYIDVLVEKSHRLKHLIDDLVEVSKATTGNLKVNLVKMDLNQLILQACGEMQEKISSVGLELKHNAEKSVIINADSKYMWRIAENLITNVVKYAVPNSRVFIDVYSKNNMGVFVIKNISSQEISINPGKLTERFVQGDESRNTEGFGLGLSIAKSLAEVQKGSLEIVVDGDLFKAIVSIPLWASDKQDNTKNNNL